MVDEHQSHSTDLSVSGEEGHSTILLAHYILWFYNWGRSCLAMLVTPQNCPKMLRNLIFVVQFAYFSIRPKNVWFFRATFEQVSLQKATFVVSWAIFEQLFVKSQVTFWKISSNLCKALSIPPAHAKDYYKNYIIDTDHASGIRPFADHRALFCKSMILLSSQASDTCAFPGFLSTFVFISAKCFYRLQAFFKDFSMDSYASELVFCSGVLS